MPPHSENGLPPGKTIPTLGRRCSADGSCKRKTPMLLTIEKVIILKSVSIFSDISERGLINVAAALEEIQAEPEQTIFQKGDSGNSLYIIVEGKMRVHDGDKTIATLGPGEVF